MRVGQRLFLAVLPAIVGLLAVASLVYWGEYARQAPEWVLLTAVIASIGSAILAWRNTRYVAQRVEQLAAGRAQRRARGARGASFRRASAMAGMALHPHSASEREADELDDIAALVDRLTEALAQSRAAQDALGELVAERKREYATLVGEAVQRATTQLDEVRLPLHILLENRFGEMNENQEELLGAARTAAESVDASLLRLQDVVQLDLGAVHIRRDRVRIEDLMASIIPGVRLAASEREIAIQMDVPPALPPIVADRGRLQEALRLIVEEQVRATPDGGSLIMAAERDRSGFRLVVRGESPYNAVVPAALASRIIRAHGGRVEVLPDRVVVHLPAAAPPLPLRDADVSR